MNGRQLRTALRGAHIVAGLVAGFLLYAVPMVSAETARTVLSFVIVPLLVLTGVAMWQQAKLRRVFKGSGPARNSESARATGLTRRA